MKPVELVERALRNSSRRRGVVLDPFGGACSTMIASEKTGLKARIIELEPRYVDVGVLRWPAFTGRQACLYGDGRTFAEIAAERLGLVLTCRPAPTFAARGECNEKDAS